MPPVMQESRRVLGVVCAFLALFGSAYATNTRSDGGRVYMNEMLVLSLRQGSSKQISSRAMWIAQKLKNLDATTPLALSVKHKFAEIVLGDQPVVTVTSGEAHEHGETPEELATNWLQNIRTALRLPPVKIEKAGLKLSPQQKAEVLLLGSEVAESTVDNSSPDIAKIYKKRNILYVRALTVGRTTISIKGPTGGDTLDIAVMPNAANLPQQVSAEVTGDPASAETVRGVVEGAIFTKVKAESRAEVEFKLPAIPSLAMGESAQYTVPVKITAPNAFPVQGQVLISVQNEPVAYKAETALWYCNDPENIRQAGNLFASQLTQHEPARLLYHHINDSGYQLFVQVKAVNNSDQEAKLLIIPGDSLPDKNPVLAGFHAGEQFLRNWIRFSGEIITIAPRSELPISLHRLYPQQTVSGLCYLRLLEGPESLLVRTDALSPDLFDASTSIALQTTAPWRVLGTQPLDNSGAYELSRDVYPAPFATQDVNYRIGGRYGYVRIGQKAIQRLDRQEKLEGNFGVLYTINANLINPTDAAIDVEIVFEASAGYSGALFIVDGVLVKTPLLQPKEESQIAKVRVEARESRNLKILTCPLSGGSYPATLTFRPIGQVDGSRTFGRR